MGDKLSPKKVSLSLAGVSGIISVICALLIAIAPQDTVRFFGAIFHGIDLSSITSQITVSGAILGTIEVIVIALIAGWLFAVIYNKIKWIK